MDCSKRHLGDRGTVRLAWLSRTSLHAGGIRALAEPEGGLRTSTATGVAGTRQLSVQRTWPSYRQPRSPPPARIHSYNEDTVCTSRWSHVSALVRRAGNAKRCELPSDSPAVRRDRAGGDCRQRNRDVTNAQSERGGCTCSRIAWRIAQWMASHCWPSVERDGVSACVPVIASPAARLYDVPTRLNLGVR